MTNRVEDVSSRETCNVFGACPEWKSKEANPASCNRSLLLQLQKVSKGIDKNSPLVRTILPIRNAQRPAGAIFAPQRLKKEFQPCTSKFMLSMLQHLEEVDTRQPYRKYS